MSNDRPDTVETFDYDHQEGIATDKAPKPVGPYPHAKKVGELLFLSGVGPRQAGSSEIPGVITDENGNVTGHDSRLQTKAVIENIKTILEASNSSLDKVVDIQVFLTDMKRDFKGFNEVYAEYFTSVGPTRTTVEVNALPTPIAVEFKVVATV